MAAETTTHNSDHVLALLTEQRDIYRKVDALAAQQRELIAGGEPERLLNVLQSRQEHILRLAQLNRALAPFRQRWDETYLAMNTEQRTRVHGLLNEINTALRSILKIDQADGALLSARTQAIGQELQVLSGKAQAGAAYEKQSGGVRGPAAADMTG